MPKNQFLLKLDGELIKAMKIRALEVGRNVNDITEELWRRYLAAPANATRGRGSSASLSKNRSANAPEGNRAKVGQGRRPGAVSRGRSRGVDPTRRERR
jgi:hypothetical protein